jgi:diacylglycerol kinase (ATP)
MAHEHSAREQLMATPTRRHATRRWLRYLIRSFGFAFAGIGQMIRTERNAQIQFLAAVLVIICGVLFRISLVEWIALVLAITFVLTLEAINTALEALVDLVNPQLHPLAKRAKDIAAGAVLLAAIGAAVVGCLVFVPKLLALW